MEVLHGGASAPEHEVCVPHCFLPFFTVCVVSVTNADSLFT